MRETDWLGADVLPYGLCGLASPKHPLPQKTRRPPCQGGQRQRPLSSLRLAAKQNHCTLLTSLKKPPGFFPVKPGGSAAGLLFCPPWQGGRRALRGRGSTMTRIFNRQVEKERRQSFATVCPRLNSSCGHGSRTVEICAQKFRRQFSVGSYVVDFYCPALKLAIEIDGRQSISSSSGGQEKTDT